MKIRLLFLSLALVLTSALGARAEDPKPAKPDKPETELEKTMHKMSKAWREVRKEARAGKLTPATADLVETVRTNAEAAEKLTPALEAEQPAADRAKFQSDYQAQLKKLVDTLGSLETALKAGDNAAAGKLISDVGEVMKSGHKQFKKPDEDK